MSRWSAGLTMVWWRRRWVCFRGGDSMLAGPVMPGPGGGDRLQILAGALLDDVEPPLGDALGIHQFPSHRDGARSGLQKLSRGLQVHAAGWNHLDLGERSFEGLDVRRSADVAAREDLDDVGARLPRRQDF